MYFHAISCQIMVCGNIWPCSVRTKRHYGIRVWRSCILWPDVGCASIFNSSDIWLLVDMLWKIAHFQIWRARPGVADDWFSVANNKQRLVAGRHRAALPDDSPQRLQVPLPVGSSHRPITANSRLPAQCQAEWHLTAWRTVTSVSEFSNERFPQVGFFPIWFIYITSLKLNYSGNDAGSIVSERIKLIFVMS